MKTDLNNERTMQGITENISDRKLTIMKNEMKNYCQAWLINRKVP